MSDEDDPTDESGQTSDAREHLERLRRAMANLPEPKFAKTLRDAVGPTQSRFEAWQGTMRGLDDAYVMKQVPLVDTGYIDAMARAKQEQIARERATVELLGKMVDLHEQTDAKQGAMLKLQQAQEVEAVAQRRREIAVIWLTGIGLIVGIVAVIVTVIGVMQAS
jgi:hypothetical protein